MNFRFLACGLRSQSGGLWLGMEESSKDKEELSAVRDLPSPVDLA